MYFRLEVVQVPVSDVNRAKAFYSEQAGFHLDRDHQVSDVRVVQLTPPGSGCAIVIGTGLSDMEPGSVEGSSWWSRTSTPPARRSSGGAST